MERIKPMTCVAFCLPNLDAGGIERVVLNVLLHMDRGRFRPVLVLGRAEGLLLSQVPGDVEVRTLRGAQARFAAPAIAKQLREAGADIAYSGTNAYNLAAVAASSLGRPRVPVIVSEHTPPSVFLDEAKWRNLRIALMRLLYRRAAAVAVPLREIGDELRTMLRLPDLPISVLPNPVLSGAFAGLKGAEPGIPLPEGPAPLLVSSGRLVGAKGFDILLRALAEVRTSTPPPNLVVLGEGPERGNLEGLALKLGVADRVRFAGRVDNPFAVMSRASLFVLSSHREGFGNVLIEAMACGVPVVAADCPFGPRAILGDGEAGQIVPPGDPAELARGIERVLGDTELARRYRAAGSEVAEQYTVSRTVPGFEELFERLGRA
jgi:glycosyltransferase involved in cell wall biosynthesis